MIEHWLWDYIWNFQALIVGTIAIANTTVIWWFGRQAQRRHDRIMLRVAKALEKMSKR